MRARFRSFRRRMGGACLVGAALAASGCAGEPRGECRPWPEAGGLGTICGFEAAEDIVAVPEDGILLVSQMRYPPTVEARGRISALEIPAAPGEVSRPWPLWPRTDMDGGSPVSPAYPPVGDPACKTPPNPDLFAPHGIDVRPGPRPRLRQVAVVAHGQREAIELFILSGPGRQALLVWQGCIPLPEGIAANDVTFAPDGSIVATNYQPTMEGLRGIWHSLKGGFLGRNTGDVLVWRKGEGWRHVAGTESAGPNGVAVTPDGKWILYAESGTGPIRRVPFEGLAEGEAPATIETGGHPDNFSWTPRGTLLNAVHDDAWGFTKCVFGQRPCRAGWLVIEIDPVAMTFVERFRHDGTDLGAVTAATEVAGRIYLAALMSDRIGVWSPAP